MLTTHFANLPGSPIGPVEMNALVALLQHGERQDHLFSIINLTHQ
jgi:hypothetical protein